MHSCNILLAQFVLVEYCCSKDGAIALVIALREGHADAAGLLLSRYEDRQKETLVRPSFRRHICIRLSHITKELIKLSIALVIRSLRFYQASWRAVELRVGLLTH